MNLGSKGKIVVTERLTFDVHAASASNTFWELWRDLPEELVDGAKVEYKVNSVKQIYPNGSEYKYTESPILYWEDEDYTGVYDERLGPGKWYHSEGPYNESARQYECVFFYIDGVYREQMVFEIEYEMTNAALRYNDCSELYLCMYSEDTVNYLNSFKGEILIPIEDMPKTGNYEVHTYGTDSHSFAFTESTSLHSGYNTFSFNLDKSDLQFSPYNEYIEFSLLSYGADKHKFTEYASRNYYYNDNVLDECRREQEEYDALPSDYRKAKIILVFTFSLWAIAIIKSVKEKEERIKSKHIFYEPTLQVYYFREIPSNLDPHFAADLVFCKHKPLKNDDDGYSAILLSLIRKKYIELERLNDQKDWTSNNIKIIIKNQPINLVNDALEQVLNENSDLEPLTPTEEAYFNLIARHAYGGIISMNMLQARIAQDYVNTDTFVRRIENSTVNIGISQGYFQKSNYDEPKKQLISSSNDSIVFGIIMLALNLLSSYTRLDLAFGAFFFVSFAFFYRAYKLRKLSSKCILLTQFGEDEYTKWRGLYNFLNSETLMKERTVIELPLWEQYLVYATAFGISDKVIAALKIRCPDIDMSPMLRNPYYRSSSFRYNSRSFRSATRSASYTARGGYSGGYGGHGGYGGGGRGGGGGRRRSLILYKI